MARPRAHTAAGPCERCWQGNLVWIGDVLRAQGRALRASAASTSMGFAWVGFGLVLLGSVPRPSLFMVRVRTGAQCTSLAPTQTQRCREYPVRCSALLCSSGFTGVARRGLSLGVLTHARTRPYIPIAMYGPYAVGTPPGHCEQYAHCLPAAPPIGASLSQACRSLHSAACARAWPT